MNNFHELLDKFTPGTVVNYLGVIATVTKVRDGCFKVEWIDRFGELHYTWPEYQIWEHLEVLSNGT